MIIIPDLSVFFGVTATPYLVIYGVSGSGKIIADRSVEKLN
jgi:hypothetical protein